MPVVVLLLLGPWYFSLTLAYSDLFAASAARWPWLALGVLLARLATLRPSHTGATTQKRMQSALKLGLGGAWLLMLLWLEVGHPSPPWSPWRARHWPKEFVPSLLIGVVGLFAVHGLVSFFGPFFQAVVGPTRRRIPWASWAAWGGVLASVGLCTAAGLRLYQAPLPQQAPPPYWLASAVGGLLAGLTLLARGLRWSRLRRSLQGAREGQVRHGQIAMCDGGDDLPLPTSLKRLREGALVTVLHSEEHAGYRGQLSAPEVVTGSRAANRRRAQGRLRWHQATAAAVIALTSAPLVVARMLQLF